MRALGLGGESDGRAFERAEDEAEDGSSFRFEWEDGEAESCEVGGGLTRWRTIGTGTDTVVLVTTTLGADEVFVVVVVEP